MLVLAALTAGCASPPPPFPELPRLSVSTHITSRNLCGLGVSPAIDIANAPPATARYRVRLTNTNVLFQSPWQTTAEAVPGGFAEGTLADYQAPCVGELRVNSFYPYHSYRLEVLALDAQNRPLAYGATAFLVQSVSVTLEQERAVRGATRIPQAPAAIGPAIDPADAESIGRFVSPTLVPQIQGPGYRP
ncbi:MAG TPA: hypothetical protein VHM01_16155 [Alphaproteobacteria bacterium]|nr:hypothetical protein [Alphaproteobacteria bacterium]